MLSFVEEFRFIPDTNDEYMVSNLGNVKSLKRGKEIYLKKPLSRAGYPHVALRVNGITKTKNVHQLVAITFLCHIPNGIGLVIDHIDNDKTNNNVYNLRIVSNKFNTTRSRKGYSFSKQKGKWHVRTMSNGKIFHVGFYNTEVEAREAYLNALKEY